MFFIKDDNFLSDLSRRYINQCFLNVGFPYYYGDELIINSGENIPFLAHVIKRRNDDLINRLFLKSENNIEVNNMNRLFGL